MQSNFAIKGGVKDLTKKKKSLHRKSSPSPRGSGCILAFGTQFLPGVALLLLGEGHDGAFGVKLGSCPQIWDLRPKQKTEKKVFVAKSLPATWRILDFTCFFCPRKKLYSFLGGTSSDLGGTASKCQPLALGLLLFWGAQPSLKRAHFLVWGTSNDLGGTTPKCAVAPDLLVHSTDLVTIVDIVSIEGLVVMVNVVGLVDMVNKYSMNSWQGRHSLAWDNETLTLLRLLKQPVFHFVYFAFTTK